MCKEICLFFKAPITPTKDKYHLGQKRCSICEIWMIIDGIRCPCCNNLLRTRTKTGKKIPMIRFA